MACCLYPSSLYTHCVCLLWPYHYQRYEIPLNTCTLSVCHPSLWPFNLCWLPTHLLLIALRVGLYCTSILGCFFLCLWYCASSVWWIVCKKESKENGGFANTNICWSCQQYETIPNKQVPPLPHKSWPANNTVPVKCVCSLKASWDVGNWPQDPCACRYLGGGGVEWNCYVPQLSFLLIICITHTGSFLCCVSHIDSNQQDWSSLHFGSQYYQMQAQTYAHFIQHI